MWSDFVDLGVVSTLWEMRLIRAKQHVGSTFEQPARTCLLPARGRIAFDCSMPVFLNRVAASWVNFIENKVYFIIIGTTRCTIYFKYITINSLYMSYAFFWVIHRHLQFKCQRFGTHCLFHLHGRVGMKCNWAWECGVFIREKVDSEK
jgi:hypothetical protein